jgi:error-prone DNA polymerase
MLKNTRDQQLAYAFCSFARQCVDGVQDKQCVSLALSRNYGHLERHYLHELTSLSRYLSVPLVATGNIYYHSPERRALQDVLTCIRERCSIDAAGFRLLQNAERWMKPVPEIHRLFKEYPQALKRSIEIAEWCEGFSLSQLEYDYPEEVCPQHVTPIQHLSSLVERGLHERYPLPRYPHGPPDKVKHLISEELALIEELHYEKYFLTCYEIVRFARSKGILCQGRGAAANSAVCFCLGITAVDPMVIDTLFARFISRERNEPPDIDIDFEHERREEVIQYIYERFGREHAGLTCEVITYRQRSAIRDVGKVLGLPNETVDALAKTIHRWTNYHVPEEDLRALGLHGHSQTIRNAFLLAQQLCGFPRHLSQHVGGFIIAQEPLCEMVPIGNAGMESRTIIEWDKDDIEALGMLKIDILALGMLTCIRKALTLVNQHLLRTHDSRYPLELHSIPPEDSSVYDMICRADTIGVFQIESRAQMSMLPRLKPRTFYDLVIEVAVVRPGPIQGNMVHPFLKRRAGLEKVSYPDQRVADILGKTLGVPLFQEQAMKLAVMLAQFTPGEAEQLRRAMAAWKRDKGVIATFRKRIIEGMQRNGYSEEFAEHCMNQIKGFSEYGFPESHAASFALLVYASAWLKCYFPAQFAAALINSQPMGFYAPSQIVRDAQDHHVPTLPIDVNISAWDCTIEYTHTDSLHAAAALRLGFRLVKGLSKNFVLLLLLAREKHGSFCSLQDLWQRIYHLGISQPGNELHLSSPLAMLSPLAEADAFQSLGLDQRTALWEIRSLPRVPASLSASVDIEDSFTLRSAYLTARDISPTTHTVPEDTVREPPPEFATPSVTGAAQVPLPLLSTQQAMFKDYERTGLSLRAHPLQFVRPQLARRGASTALALRNRPLNARTQSKAERMVRVAGIAIVRQRPGTARGVVFITLEDETGISNLIIRPDVFEKYHRIIISSSSLLAEGILERVGEVVYVATSYLESLDSLVLPDKDPGLPNLSYS